MQKTSKAAAAVVGYASHQRDCDGGRDDDFVIASSGSFNSR